MVNPELIASWELTVRHLKAARFHFSADSKAKHAQWLTEVDHFIDHDELGIAYDYLESLARETEWHCSPLLEALVLAARNMGKDDEVALLISRLAELGCVGTSSDVA